MMVRPHLWRVQLTMHTPAAEMTFQHQSLGTGLQVLDSVMWPLSPDVRTERAYLAELYDGVLQFMETRA